MSKVKKSVKNLAKCKCVTCPSFTLGCELKAAVPDMAKVATGMENKEHFEALYCAYEPSSCINEERGCKCPDCEVEHDYKMHHEYYCLHDVNRMKKP